MNIEPESFTSFADRFLQRMYANNDKLVELSMRTSRAYAMATQYESMPLPPVQAVAKCECGSGSNERSGAHSHWCQLWMAP
jgi:hypothetical protein